MIVCVCDSCFTFLMSVVRIAFPCTCNYLTSLPTHSSLQIDLLLVMYHSPTEDQPELSDNQKEVLEGLKGKIETMINEYGEAGAFLRLNTKAPTDAILERNDCDYVQSMQVGREEKMRMEREGGREGGREEMRMEREREREGGREGGEDEDRERGREGGRRR